MVGEPAGHTVSRKGNKGGKKQGPNLGALVDTFTVGLFGLVATATGHEHWLKEREDVIPITDPLKAWIDTLPSKTLKKLESKLAPTLFVVGLATVVGPDAIAEVKLRAEEKRFRHFTAQQAQRGGFKPGVEPATAGGGAGARGANGASSSAGEWAGSVPADSPLHGGYDV